MTEQPTREELDHSDPGYRYGNSSTGVAKSKMPMATTYVKTKSLTDSDSLENDADTATTVSSSYFSENDVVRRCSIQSSNPASTSTSTLASVSDGEKENEHQDDHEARTTQSHVRSVDFTGRVRSLGMDDSTSDSDDSFYSDESDSDGDESSSDDEATIRHNNQGLKPFSYQVRDGAYQPQDDRRPIITARSLDFYGRATSGQSNGAQPLMEEVDEEREKETVNERELKQRIRCKADEDEGFEVAYESSGDSEVEYSDEEDDDKLIARMPRARIFYQDTDSEEEKEEESADEYSTEEDEEDLRDFALKYSVLSFEEEQRVEERVREWNITRRTSIAQRAFAGVDAVTRKLEDFARKYSVLSYEEELRVEERVKQWNILRRTSNARRASSGVEAVTRPTTKTTTTQFTTKPCSVRFHYEEEDRRMDQRVNRWKLQQKMASKAQQARMAKRALEQKYGSFHRKREEEVKDDFDRVSDLTTDTCSSNASAMKLAAWI